MQGVLGLLIMASIGSGQLTTSPDCPERELAVTVQIHDYARVRSDHLSRASDLVTRLYKTIGVRTEWFEALRQGERRPRAVSKEGLRARIAQLTIIVLTEEMAKRGRVADGVLGYAAIPEEGMGRIAYVIYDRVRQTAFEGMANEAELLAFVIAHEMAHLLQVRGPQSEAGLMRSRWNRNELRQLDVLKVGFSAAEARQIRATIENEPASAITSAARAGSSEVDVRGRKICSPAESDSLAAGDLTQ